MKSHTALMLLALALYMGATAADTFYLRSGIQIQGRLIRNVEGRTLVQTGRSTVAYRPEEILRIEKNTHTGALDKAEIQARAKQRAQQRLDETGLNNAQHRQIYALLHEIQSSDRVTSANAKKALVDMGGKTDLFPYFVRYLPEYSARLVPGVLEVLARLDGRRARPLLRGHAADLHEDSRAAALLFLGKTGDRAASEIVARGLVDPSDMVRRSAAHAAAALQIKAATPLLIANLGIPDRRVQNTAKEALRMLWKTDEAATAAQWSAYWKAHAATIENPYFPQQLRPLINPKQIYENE
jgi:HEAT repeat protein